MALLLGEYLTKQILIVLPGEIHWTVKWDLAEEEGFTKVFH